jgi:hypothetical protein
VKLGCSRIKRFFLSDMFLFGWSYASNLLLAQWKADSRMKDLPYKG